MQAVLVRFAAHLNGPIRTGNWNNVYKMCALLYYCIATNIFIQYAIKCVHDWMKCNNSLTNSSNMVAIPALEYYVGHFTRLSAIISVLFFWRMIMTNKYDHNIVHGGTFVHLLELALPFMCDRYEKPMIIFMHVAHWFQQALHWWRLCRKLMHNMWSRHIRLNQTKMT